MNRLEKAIERDLVRRYSKAGGKAYKIECPGVRGFPDRLALLPIPKEHRAIVNRYVRFIETKTAVGRVSLNQKCRHQELIGMGYTVRIVRG